MRPRWHYVAISIASGTGLLIILLASLYTISLAVFFLRASGVWFAPVFGLRGWESLLRSLPWLLLACTGAFIITLEALVKRYEIGYRTPFLISTVAVVAVVVGGGYIVASTPLHNAIARLQRTHHLPSFMDDWYRHPTRPARISDVKTGRIAAYSTSTLILLDSDEDADESTTTILITPETLIPYGDTFGPQDTVVVIGDAAGTGTMRAFGVRKIERPD
jgi:hypothetical protein